MGMVGLLYSNCQPASAGYHSRTLGYMYSVVGKHVLLFKTKYTVMLDSSNTR